MQCIPQTSIFFLLFRSLFLVDIFQLPYQPLNYCMRLLCLYCVCAQSASDMHSIVVIPLSCWWYSYCKTMHLPIFVTEASDSPYTVLPLTQCMQMQLQNFSSVKKTRKLSFLSINLPNYFFPLTLLCFLFYFFEQVALPCAQHLIRHNEDWNDGHCWMAYF